jgi:hypothetical protein
VLGGTRQRHLRIADMGDAGARAKVAARNIEQARGIAACAADGDINHALAAYTGGDQSAPQLHNQFRFSARRCDRKQAPHQFYFVCRLNWGPWPRRGGQALAQPQSLRHQREQRLVDAIHLTANRIAGGIFWRGAAFTHVRRAYRGFSLSAKA